MRLVGAGHQGALDYGWSAFLAALAAEAQAREERMRDMALAFRVALFAEEKQFKAFLEA